MIGSREIRRANLGVTSADIPNAVAWIASEAEALGATERQCFGAQLCAEEILANAVRHGGRSHMTLIITLEFLEDRLRLTLQDDGPPFDFTNTPVRKMDATLEESRPGGWGIALIRRFADHVLCRREGDRNVVVLDFIGECDS
ncbi:MAG: ATP-binding protein [Alphaproteobacteria bacterium]|nr:ATP-binding protein [Alphaproteobacteria bacterium]MBM3624135.1 ATP-binding protein [Alphaproteobacteria bacterium]MBM3640567.1 ATP-binding protein [Alphaproteobacteria bacterium]